MEKLINYGQDRRAMNNIFYVIVKLYLLCIFVVVFIISTITVFIISYLLVTVVQKT